MNDVNVVHILAWISHQDSAAIMYLREAKAITSTGYRAGRSGAAPLQEPRKTHFPTNRPLICCMPRSACEKSGLEGFLE